MYSGEKQGNGTGTDVRPRYGFIACRQAFARETLSAKFSEQEFRVLYVVGVSDAYIRRSVFCEAVVFFSQREKSRLLSSGFSAGYDLALFVAFKYRLDFQKRASLFR